MTLAWLRSRVPGDPVTFTVEESTDGDAGIHRIAPVPTDASVVDATVETEVVELASPADGSEAAWCIDIDLTYEDDQRRRTTYLSRTAPVHGSRPEPTVEADAEENVIRVQWGR